jgi:predicted amidohydrolase YtcJ
MQSVWFALMTTLCIVNSAHALTLVSAKRIHTVDAEKPSVEAFVFDQHGKILAIGATEALAKAYPTAKQQAFPNATILPGLIDAHGHLYNLGAHLQNVDLVGTKSIAEIIARLQAFAKANPQAKWLIGRGWDQNDWAEQTFPSAKDLDREFVDQPVLLERIDGHALWANSAAMAYAPRDLDGDWQPEGGSIVRKAGKPTGLFIDRAGALLEQAVPAPSPSMRSDYLKKAAAQAASMGLTGVHDAGTTLADYTYLEKLATEQSLPLRVYAMADGDSDAFNAICPMTGKPAHLRHSSGRLEMRAIKFYVDGALGSRGAALLEVYSDAKDQSGLLIQPENRYQILLQRALDCGLQVNTHAIGDRANRIVLDALQNSGKASEGIADSRHRIEHAQVLHPDDIPRFARLGIIASVQPTHATSDMPWAKARVGAVRVRSAYAWQSLLKSNAKLALGSDFPVEQVSPWLGLYAAITRQDQAQQPKGGWYAEQSLTREQALYGFTLGAAFAAFADTQVGSISVGKRADFVVIDRDVMQVLAKDIPTTRVLHTFIDGKATYDAN